MRKSLILALLLTVPAAAAFAGTNSLAVTPGAALAGTNFGLELTFADGDNTATYVLADETKGFNNECDLNVSFHIGPDQMTMSNVAGSNHVQILALHEDFAPEGPQLLGFLQRGAGTDNLFFTMWYKDRVGDVFNFAGTGFLALYQNAGWDDVRVDIEYRCGSPGTLTVSRTPYTGGVPGGTVQIYNVSIANATGVVNKVFFGNWNPNSQFAGTSGTLNLDEFTSSR